MCRLPAEQAEDVLRYAEWLRRYLDSRSDDSEEDFSVSADHAVDKEMVKIPASQHDCKRRIHTPDQKMHTMNNKDRKTLCVKE